MEVCCIKLFSSSGQSLLFCFFVAYFCLVSRVTKQTLIYQQVLQKCWWNFLLFNMELQNLVCN